MNKPSQIALIVDAIAEANGIAARHVVRFPKLLEPYGLDPDDIDPATIEEAEAWHGHEVQRIAAKLGAEYSRF